MSVEAWIADAETATSSCPGTAERTWAWAHFAHAAALSEIRNAPADHMTDAVWVEPAMAWTLDDLADAGIAIAPLPLPPIPPGSDRDLLIASLRRLLSYAADDDPAASLRVADACAQAVRRASLALEQLTGALP